MAHRLTQIFVENMRQWRKHTGMTHFELSKRSGLTATYLSQLENGKRNPHLSTVGRVADGLGISSQQIITEGSLEASLTTLPTSEVGAGKEEVEG